MELRIKRESILAIEPLTTSLTKTDIVYGHKKQNAA